jgi:tetratricopeptide (TPR) repeat protein
VPTTVAGDAPPSAPRAAVAPSLFGGFSAAYGPGGDRIRSPCFEHGRIPAYAGVAQQVETEAAMGEMPTLLKALLTERHMQSHMAFSREYTAVARRVAPALATTAPGREQYQRWLSGRVKTKPHPDHCRVLERMFPGRTVTELFSPVPEPQAAPEEGTTTNRRELFQLGGATVAATFFERLWSEPTRMHSALDRGSVSPALLSILRHDATDLGVRVIRVPPSTLMDEALAQFRNVRRLIGKKQSLAAQRELAVCGAMFATVLGEILFNEGAFPLAAQWYGVARRAAEEAGEQYLADIALAGNTYLPTYAPDPRAVLANVTPRLEAKHTASPAIAWLWGFRAKAHAMLGDADAFQESIDRARQALDRSSPDLIQPGIFSFVPEKLAFYEARGWVELNDADAASAAADHAISLYDFTETTEPALARFEQASAYAQDGELAEACRIATTAVLDRRTYHGVTVVSRAHEFDRLLGPSNAESVRDWREVLTSLRRPQFALTAAHDKVP